MLNNDKNSIEVVNVSKVYNLYNNSTDRLREIISFKGKKFHQEYYALNNISFQVEQGETFGIIGTNGAGKSTLLKLITGVAMPTKGEINVKGRISALLELGAGFNQNYTGLENIYLNGTMMGYTKQEMSHKVKDIVEFADIGDFIYQPVKTYSSGMFARLAFAVAINIEPEILIVDEALSVGDVFFQNKCYKKFEELRSKGITVIFVSHDIGTVKQLCTRVLWLEHGEQQMIGDSVSVCNEYSNSILNKRASEYVEGDRHEEINMVIKNKELVSEIYPEIRYSNESILNPDVEIVSSFIVDENGKIPSEYYAGKKYILSIVFKTRRKIKNCIAGFVLETVKGIWVTNCNTLNSGLKKSFEIDKDTLNKVEFKFIMPSFVNGDYVIGVAISEGSIMDFKVLTWLYNVLYVQITNVSGNDSIFQLDTEVDVYSKVIE